MSVRLNYSLAAAVAAVLSIGAGTNAAIAADEEPAVATPPADTQSGMVVVRDKKTGKLRAPTAEEAEELSQQSAKEKELKRAPQAAAPTVQTLPSGAVSMRLGEEHMNYEVAQIGPDGKVIYECVHGSKAAEQRLKTPPATLETE